MPWNGPAWFMSALVVYWLLLRPLTRYFRNVPLTSCLGWLFLCFCYSLVIHFVWAGSNSFPGKLMQFCLYHSFQNGALGYFHTFVAGVIAARIFILTSLCDEQTRARVVNVDDCGKLALNAAGAPFIFQWGCCLGYSLYALCSLMPAIDGGKDQYGLDLRIFSTDSKWWLFWHNGGCMPFMLLVILGSATGSDPIAKYIFTHPFPVALAQLSFSQYLLQFPIHNVMVRFMPFPPPGAGDRYMAWPFWANVAYIPILISVAYMVQRFLQRPYTEWQNWRAEKKIKGTDDLLIERIDAYIASLTAPPPTESNDVQLADATPRSLEESLTKQSA